MRHIEVGLASPVAAMEAFLEPHRPWIESVVGCSRPETVTFEFAFPFNHLAAEELLSGATLDRRCLGSTATLRPLVARWETAPGASPRIELHASRDRKARIAERKLAWDPHWKETPIALWFHGLRHAVVTVDIPYVSYIEKGELTWRQWIIVNRSEAAAVLNLLRGVEPPKQLAVMGGRNIPLPENGYDWNAVVLDPALNQLVREDYEAFFEREAWFARHRIPYRRGYLLHGPPGNGKTSVARIMACRPQVAAYSIDFSSEGLPSEALWHLFETAGDNAPALVILEDLDRVFGANSEGVNRTHITLQQLLNGLDGLGTQDGIVVVATANNPNSLDPALLRRPGRFDRLALFPMPSLAIRKEYLARLTNGTLDEQAIAAVARESDRLSFAQIREAYILAGQFALQGDGEIRLQELLAGVRRLRTETNGLSARADGRAVGFEAATSDPSAEVVPVCKKH
jgi:ATP-dependent 26S proteasome regulatory subunit